MSAVVGAAAPKPVVGVSIIASNSDGSVAKQAVSASDFSMTNAQGQKVLTTSAVNETYPKSYRDAVLAGDFKTADGIFPSYSTDMSESLPVGQGVRGKVEGVLQAFAAAGMLVPEKIVAKSNSDFDTQPVDSVLISVSNATPENRITSDTDYLWKLSDLNAAQKSAVDIARLSVSELTKDSKNQATVANKLAAQAMLAALAKMNYQIAAMPEVPAAPGYPAAPGF
jgi:hypothetical protein